MNVFEGSKKLVETELVMLFCQVIICLNNLVEIRLHELKKDISIFEVLPRWRQHDVLDLDDVSMP
jgi:hypothetical protein